MSSRRIAVRRSGVHGKGVFAVEPIKAGERVVEYKGERISWKEALRRHPHDPNEPNHTFYFALEEGGVIDGKIDGNSARWINHSCAPNCEAEEIKGRVFIHALRDIGPEEELFYDYGLVIDETLTLLARRVDYTFAAERGKSLYASTHLTILRPDREDEIAALQSFSKLADQEVSFTDCVSFALMKRHRVRRAFTFDGHFRAAGFEVWPRRPS